MRIGKSLTILAVLTMLVLVAACNIPEPEPEVAGPALKLTSGAAAVGEEVEVNIDLQEVTNAFGYQMDVSYDPAILEFVSISEGSFLNEEGVASTFWITPSSAELGFIRKIANVRMEKTGIDGSGTLAILKFKAKAQGEAAVSFVSYKVLDYDTNELILTPVNGKVTVS